ncbi:MAG: hypothetical protein ABEJ65_01995, partial [bacterium]
FSIDLPYRVHSDILKTIQGLSPIVETLELGEWFVETGDGDQFRSWIEQFQEKQPYPVSGALADSGWLARIISMRQSAGDWTVVDSGQFEEEIQSVERSEIWGLGSGVKQALKDADIETLGELYYQEEVEWRRLMGRASRNIHKIFNAGDPRPVSAFARPNSLSRELELEEKHDTTEDLLKFLEPHLEQFQEQLESSASLAYRISFRAGSRGQEKRTFTTPTDQVDLFKVALERILSEWELSELPPHCELELDVIVSDLKHYHQALQEDVTDIEIMD